MGKTWATRAALYELLSQTFLYTKRETVEALVTGEYQDALVELIIENGIVFSSNDTDVDLQCYVGKDSEDTLHALRREHTRLFVGTRGPLVCPYAGMQDAKDKGQPPLLFVGKESMQIERFMRKCGVVHAGPSNDPLDHIGSMLEFLMHLCTIRSGLVVLQDGVQIPENAYEEFYEKHFIGFARVFAQEVMEESHKAFFAVGAHVLKRLPDTAL